MSHKKKGQLTGYGEWHKHLRKIGKRIFWKRERRVANKVIDFEIRGKD